MKQHRTLSLSKLGRGRDLTPEGLSELPNAVDVTAYGRRIGQFISNEAMRPKPRQVLDEPDPEPPADDEEDFTLRESTQTVERVPAPGADGRFVIHRKIGVDLFAILGLRGRMTAPGLTDDPGWPLSGSRRSQDLR